MKRLMFVDDDAMMLQLFRLDIEQRQSEIDLLTAQSGNEAIELLETHQPHALVLDLRLTNGDGFTVLEHIKQKQYTFPVIVLTNYNKPEYRDQCQQYGVREYLIKSEIRINRLMDTVTGYIDSN